MIFEDREIKKKILSMWKQFKELERVTRRPDRSYKPTFLAKQERFVNNILDMPFPIVRHNYAIVLKESNIKDW